MKDIEIAKKIIIKEIEKAGLQPVRIILFGSRARGNYSEESDWDLLVVVKNELTRKKRKTLLGSIYRQLAKLQDSYEIVIKTERDFERMKGVVGSLSYEAELEGITI